MRRILLVCIFSALVVLGSSAKSNSTVSATSTTTTTTTTTSTTTTTTTAKPSLSLRASSGTTEYPKLLVHDEEDEDFNEVDGHVRSEYEAIYHDYVDNRIDMTPTFVTPVEKFLQSIINPWVHPDQTIYDESNLGKLINGITKPIRDIVKPAVTAGRSNSFGDVLNIIGDRFKVIYPGTAWCGAGNAAQNPQEVGLFEKTDRCCQAHDQCTMSMGAGEAMHGLVNSGMFTRSHCLCDANFYYCLKRVRSLISTNIGYTYFNLLRPQCFKLEYPAYCARFGNTRLMQNKCLDYGYNFNAERRWQWFDTPDFI